MRIPVYLAITVFVIAAAGTALCQEVPADKPPAEDQPGDTVELKKIISEQKEIIDRLSKELNEAKEALEKLKKEMTTEKKETPAGSKPSAGQGTKEQPQPKKEPSLKGQITHVRMETKVVLVNLGEDHNLAKGDVFEVVRAGKKIGKIRILVILQEDMSNAEVVEAKVDFLKGDKVVMVTPARQKPPSAEKPEPEQKPVQKPAQETPKTKKPPRAGGADDLSRRLETLEGLYDDLAKQVQHLEDRLEKGAKVTAEQDLRKSVPQAEPKKVERPSELKATIADVTKTYVILSVGTDDGLKQGDTFVIKRGEKEIAKVRVIRLDTDICRADFISKNEEIQKMRDVAILE
jgi:uncharacterized phage infection (PIP) family protein YhgE